MTRSTRPAPRSRKASFRAAVSRWSTPASRWAVCRRRQLRPGRAGIAIVRRALQQPLRQIAENAGVDGAVVAGKVLENDDKHFGFDAQNEEYGDMLGKGIIDPAKVVRTALQDAASVAGLLITTEAMVAEKPETEGRCPGRRHARHGRHGRHDVISRKC